jgi:hypothetical protein
MNAASTINLFYLWVACFAVVIVVTQNVKLKTFYRWLFAIAITVFVIGLHQLVPVISTPNPGEFDPKVWRSIRRSERFS